MLEYHDRGIMKWAPFDALQGHHALISELKYRLGKIEKPILSEEQYETMNRNLNDAWQNKKIVRVTYFYDGYLYDFESYILKIDYIFGILKFKQRILNYDWIVKLEV